jgi:ubiquinol-cytochrome c reductase cytochrome b subunit
MYRLSSFDTYQPVMPRPNAKGKITASVRLRAALSRWFFEDRIAPVSAGELAEAKKHAIH